MPHLVKIAPGVTFPHTAKVTTQFLSRDIDIATLSIRPSVRVCCRTGHPGKFGRSPVASVAEAAGCRERPNTGHQRCHRSVVGSGEHAIRSRLPDPEDICRG